MKLNTEFAERHIEKLGVAAVACILIVRWLGKFMIWPDSANYLTAAMNFVKHGTLFIYASWPSGSFLPEIEPFTAYPSGFPLFLTPFVFLFRDPLIAAAVAHSLVLIAFLALMALSARKLKMAPLVCVVMLFFYAVFPSFRDILTGLLTEPLYISLSLGVFLCSLELVERPRKSIWVLALILLFCSAAIRWNGFANAAFFLFPLWRQRSHWLVKAFAIGTAACAPNLLWFLRNKLAYGSATRLYGLEFFIWENIPVPFRHTLLRWGFDSYLILFFVVGLSLLPFFFPRVREKLAFPNYLQTWLGVLVQFLGIYILSLMVRVTPVDDRYLSPSYTFFILALFASISALVRQRKEFGYLILIPGALGLIAAPVYLYAKKKNPIEWVGRFNRPEEESLWKVIRSRPYFEKASHFYSDDNFLHQIFVEKPHRIIWSNYPTKRSDEVYGFWNIGQYPFFVVKENTDLHKLFTQKIPAGVKTEQIGTFIVYYRD